MQMKTSCFGGGHSVARTHIHLSTKEWFIQLLLGAWHCTKYYGNRQITHGFCPWRTANFEGGNKIYNYIYVAYNYIDIYSAVFLIYWVQCNKSENSLKDFFQVETKSEFLTALPKVLFRQIYSDLQTREDILQTCGHWEMNFPFTSERVFGIPSSFEKFPQKSKQGDLGFQKKTCQSMAFGILNALNWRECSGF